MSSPCALLPERHPEVRQQRLRVLVGSRRGDDDHVHAPDLVDLVVHDLGKDQLLSQAQGIIAAAVEALRRYALEVAHAGKRRVDQAVEELVHPRAAERDLRPDRHAFSELEVRDRLLGPGDDRLLARDRPQIGGGEVHHLRVLPRLADADVDHDLLQPWHLERVRVPALLHETRHDGLEEPLLQSRRHLAASLGLRRRGRRLLGRALVAPGLGLRLRSLRGLGLLGGGFLFGLGHDHALSMLSPHRLQTRTLRPSASACAPVRDGRSHFPQTTMTFERWMNPSRSMMPPCRSFCVGRWCFLIMLTCSTSTRPAAGTTRSTLPRLPRSLPPRTATISPRRTCTLMSQRTSGAREMIFVNWRSRSSRATGPKMRVPTGFSSGLISTTAFRSNRMYEPSFRRTSLTVRTTTARATSPFLTVPSGAASFTATITVSPREAYRLLAPPITRMHWTFLAPELSATSSIERGWIIAYETRGFRGCATACPSRSAASPRSARGRRRD